MNYVYPIVRTMCLLGIAILLGLTACKKEVSDPEVSANTSTLSSESFDWEGLTEEQIMNYSSYKVMAPKPKPNENKRPKVPYVNTLEVSAITATTMTTGGDVTLPRGAPPVTQRGVVFGLFHQPTIDTDYYTIEGSGTGTFTSVGVDLEPNTPYFVRAYAINADGIAYDDTEIYMSTGDPSSSYCEGTTITDSRDGKVYRIVQVEDQCWMAENLNVGIRVNGAQGQANNNEIEKYCYNDDEANCTEYGGQYEWEEVMGYTAASNTNPSNVQGICPSGWHIPSYSEISQLSIDIGGTSVGGGKLKEAGFDHWKKKKKYPGGTDVYGFTSLGSGHYSISSGLFVNMLITTRFWTTTTFFYYPSPNRNFAYTLVHGYFNDGQGHNYLDYDMISSSVRCVKDGVNP